MTVVVVLVVLAGAGRMVAWMGGLTRTRGVGAVEGPPSGLTVWERALCLVPRIWLGLFDGMGIWGMVLAGAKAPFLGAKRASGNTWLPRYVWMYLVTYLEVQPTVHKVSTPHGVGK